MTIVQELYADEFGSHVGKYSERLKLTKKGETLMQAPLMHLQSVTIASMGVSISADALAACCERGIPVYFIDHTGNPYASVIASGLGGTVLTRRAQLAAYTDQRGVHVGLAIAAAKINNSAATLKYVAKSRKETNPDQYELLRMASLEVMDHVMTLDLLGRQVGGVDEMRASLMAAEGQAATHYWAALRTIIPEEYGWDNRTTRGATDPINSLLNYGYAILRKRVEYAIVLAGLDPFAGFIHADRPGKPSLALDLIEEFRSVGVDRLVIGLVNRHFEVKMTEEGYMDDETRRRFAEKMVEHLKATVRYEGARFPIQTVVQMQARKLAAFLRGETDAYVPYKAEW